MQSQLINNPYVDVMEHGVRAIIKLTRVANLCKSTMDGLLSRLMGPRSQGALKPKLIFEMSLLLTKQVLIVLSFNIEDRPIKSNPIFVFVDFVLHITAAQHTKGAETIH